MSCLSNYPAIRLFSHPHSLHYTHKILCVYFINGSILVIPFYILFKLKNRSVYPFIPLTYSTNIFLNPVYVKHHSRYCGVVDKTTCCPGSDYVLIREDRTYNINKERRSICNKTRWRDREWLGVEAVAWLVRDSLSEEVTSELKAEW